MDGWLLLAMRASIGSPANLLNLNILYLDHT